MHPKFLTCLATVLVLGQAEAALLVYEGFDGYGAAGAVIGTPVPNANTLGLDKTIAYRATNWRNAAGLTFGALQTSGGAVAYDAANATYLSTKLDLNGNPGTTSSFTGTLYGSYLVNITSVGSDLGGNGVQTRVSEAFNSSLNSHFFSDADTRNATSLNPAVGYGGTVTTTNSPLVASTTYLMISRFTNVGTTLGGGVTGVGSLFVLTEAQFANMLLQPNWELYLDNPSTTVGTGAGQIYGRANTAATTTAFNGFNDDLYLHFLAVANGVFDEFRYGDSLVSVLPIPEPGRGLLMMIGLSGVFLRRRR
ncbi:PEP-CTERM sorting domain-containing protein [Phragmitibacter flavus]|nr:PEP-CTERM sorting domain-containing protein [Phragmitibacter flavus]